MNGDRQLKHIPPLQKRAAKRARFISLLMMLLSIGGIGVSIGVSGIQESLLCLALPAYKTYNAAAPVAATLPAATPKAPRLSVSEAETVYHSVAAMAGAHAEEPEILIYHTHATEAYLQTEDESYVESAKWRTEDESSSVVAVGTLLQKTLEEQYGRCVLHDTRNHEPPKLSTAYGRSLDAMLSYGRRYPTLRVYIDLHRDAYGTADEHNGEPKDYVEIGGKEVARIMCVVGTGKGATGTGFDELPDFEANYAFAQAVTDALRTVDAGLTRDIRVKTGRYNQHVSTRCLLVEVGHNANTLEQAKNAVPYLAEAIDAVLSGSAVKTASPPARDVWTPLQTDENGG